MLAMQFLTSRWYTSKNTAFQTLFPSSWEKEKENLLGVTVSIHRAQSIGVIKCRSVYPSLRAPGVWPGATQNHPPSWGKLSVSDKISYSSSFAHSVTVTGIQALSQDWVPHSPATSLMEFKGSCFPSVASSQYRMRSFKVPAANSG